jgi:hypothetical protein
LAFDIDRIKNHLENYTKDKSPTKIVCYLKVNDSSDSSDINREDRFNNFFLTERSSLINNEGYGVGYPHESTTKIENNTVGLSNAVITVTPVTTQNTTKDLDYNIISNLPDTLYRLYKRGDIRGCKNCNQRGDKWYILNHYPNCKMDKK